MDVCVIIPALNEESTVGIVVRRLLEKGPYEVIVADNGSADRTAQVAAAAGARVVHEPRRGYGAACLAGAKASVGKVLVFMDADGSFDPGDIPALVAPIVEGWAELVLGSRVLAGETQEAVLPHQRFGNWLAVKLLWICHSLKVTDLGPFRAICRDLLFQLKMSEMTYGWPIEMMIKAQKLHCAIMEVPVRCRPRVAGHSKVSGTVRGSILAGYHIIKVILKYSVRRWRASVPSQKGARPNGA